MVNSLYSAHCRDLKLVSSVARVRNSGSLFQWNVCNLFLPGIYLLSVLSGCPQGESWLYTANKHRLLSTRLESWHYISIYFHNRLLQSKKGTRHTCHSVLNNFIIFLDFQLLNPWNSSMDWVLKTTFSFTFLGPWLSNKGTKYSRQIPYSSRYQLPLPETFQSHWFSQNPHWLPTHFWQQGPCAQTACFQDIAFPVQRKDHDKISLFYFSSNQLHSMDERFETLLMHSPTMF